jgi:hypothetical protein
MDKILIDSKIVVGDKLNGFSESIIKNETMLFNCDFESAYILSNEPTRQFLNALPEDWKNNRTIIDSRVHMLMPNWYPCIPGYHHDDVPRERSDGQPNYFDPSYRSEHAMILYNGSICPTEFAIGIAEFDDVQLGDIYYKKWHQSVMEKLNAGQLEKISAPENTVIFFNDRTWHQGVKAVSGGWRLFIRASRNTGRRPTNEVRRQVQVYLENPMEGW